MEKLLSIENTLFSICITLLRILILFAQSASLSVTSTNDDLVKLKILGIKLVFEIQKHPYLMYLSMNNMSKGHHVIEPF